MILRAVPIPFSLPISNGSGNDSTDLGTFLASYDSSGKRQCDETFLHFIHAILLRFFPDDIASKPVTVISPSPLITKTNLDSSLFDTAGVWVDAEGNVFVASWGYVRRNGNDSTYEDCSHRIYKQSAVDRSVSVFAGNEDGDGFSGDGGDATKATLDTPEGLWGDNENLYICDRCNQRIRAVNFTNNKITTILGEGWNGVTTVPQPAKDVSFSPRSLWGDGQGNLYITTATQLLFYSATKKTVQSFGYSPSGTHQTGLTDGKPVLFSDWALPGRTLRQVTGDVSRNCLYVVESNYDQDEWNSFAAAGIIRRFDLGSKTTSVFAGQLASSGSTDRFIDGSLAREIQFSPGLSGIWAANDGTVFVSDIVTASISAIHPDTKEIRWFAGTWNDGGDSVGRADQDTDNQLAMGGSAKEGKIFPYSLAGNSQSLYVVDSYHNAVRKISPLALKALTFPILLLPNHRKQIEEEEEMGVHSVHFRKRNKHLRGNV
jgi:hypothetical protein